MGALAPLSHWIPEDDLLLKNSIEAGASLESLAKGAVQFSRRFTVQELQDRWHALLYDTVVSAEASALMIEFDHSASTPKCNRFENSKESKESILMKRKSESIRSCYYAMRKRIRNDPFDSMDMNFLGGAGNNDEPQSVDCVFIDSIRDTFGNQQLNVDVISNGILEHGHDDSVRASDGVTASPCFPIGLRNHNGDIPLRSFNAPEDFHNVGEESVSLTENQSTVGELGQLKELPVCGLFEAEALEPNLPSMTGPCDDNLINSSVFESQVFNSPVPHCSLSFDNLGYSPTPPEMPDWSTIGDISIPALPDFEEGLNEHNTFVVAIDGSTNKTDASGYGVVSSNSNLRDDMSGDELTNSAPSTDDYLAELSKSLLNFSDEEDLFGPDGNETINKSYFDGLSSLLLDCPDGGGDMPDKGVSEASNAPDERHTILEDACPREFSDKCVYQYGDKPLASSSEFQMLSSALTVNPAFPEMRGGVICCTLSSEDPEVPSNDDVFLPVRMPSTSFPSMAYWKYDETYHPLSSSVKDLSINHRTNDGRAVLMKNNQNSHSEYSTSYQMIELPSKSERFNSDHKVKYELPNDNNQHVLRRNLNTSDISRPVISGKFSAVNACQGAVKENSAKDEHGKSLSWNYADASQCLEKKAICTKEHGITTTLQKNEPILAETVLMKTTIPETNPNNFSSDSEEFLCESDEDIPYFSDVEALILDMDLSPNNQDIYSSKGVKTYHVEDPRTIIRLEQADHACERRDIAAHGAFAVLAGRRSKHFIRKPAQTDHQLLEHKPSNSKPGRSKEKRLTTLPPLPIHWEPSQLMFSEEAATPLSFVKDFFSLAPGKSLKVLLGRASADVKVDIDLGRESRHNKISRRQATIKMDMGGLFHLRNVGKYSIHVNGKEVHRKQSLTLTSGSFIEVRDLTFLFEINQSEVKRYIDILKESQSLDIKA